jgi:hypothetical protein
LLRHEFRAVGKASQLNFVLRFNRNYHFDKPEEKA